MKYYTMQDGSRVAICDANKDIIRADIESIDTDALAQAMFNDSKLNTIEFMARYIAMRLENSETATIDDGLIGKAFEVAIRYYMTHRRNFKVKAQGKADIRSKVFGGKAETVEIKTACGELDDTLKDSCKWIIYCPDVDLNLEAEYQAYVFSKDEWIAFLENYNGRGSLTRRTSNGKLHIQSFYVSDSKRPKASKAIANYIIETCNGQSLLADFYE